MAKLKPGDVIVRVNGRDVKGAEEFSEMLTKAGSGEEVKFTVERPQEAVTFELDVNPWRRVSTGLRMAIRNAEGSEVGRRRLEDARH